MDKVLLDTDVILDFFFDRTPFSNYSAEVISLSANNIITGYVTPVIICNCYYLLRKTASHQYVIEKLSLLLSIVEVVQMDRQIVMEALSSDFADFEDALQYFSANKEGSISVILTRNLRDYAKSKLLVMTPETFLKETKFS